MTDRGSMLLHREGRVVSVMDGRVTVSVALPEGCARCARGEGCGFGLRLGPRERCLVLALPPGLELSSGDPVRVVMDQGGLTSVSSAVYGIPLAGLLAGAAAATGLGLSEAASIGLSLGTFVAGLLLARRWAATLADAGSRCRPRLLAEASPDA